MARKTKEVEVGTRIANGRLHRGLSQTTVARRSGIDPSYLSRIETGKVHPTVRTALRIATAMKMPLADLLGPSPPEIKEMPCPISSSGRCLMDLISTGMEGDGHPGEVEHYTPRQLRLLRRFLTLLQRSNPALLRSLEVLFAEILQPAD